MLYGTGSRCSRERDREAEPLRVRVASSGGEFAIGVGRSSAVVLALVSLLAVGCTGGAEPSGAPSASGKSVGVQVPLGESEEEQGNRARAVLETVGADGPGFVESGLERVRDGLHHRSSLVKGEDYEVSVVCVGTGSVRVVVDRGDAQVVACDGVSVRRGVESAPAELSVDVTAEAGATGMVAWRVVSVSPAS
ncbi:hypothetical protein [Streptomyces sp. cmx-4-25]|uniref:hypothetical protein n=1 Tax=unclassified Streptomyces TaxID=2593676 RepID=UPI00397F4E7B